MPTKASSPAQFLITLSGFGFEGGIGKFAVKTGGNRTSQVRRYHDGGEPDEQVAGGPANRDDMTLNRPFKRDRDLQLARWADRNVGQARGSIAIQALDGDFHPFGRPVIHSDCLLMTSNWPDVDAEAVGDVARLELVFAVSGTVG